MPFPAVLDLRFNLASAVARLASLWRGGRMRPPLHKSLHCRILGFATEYNTSVKKFTATYVNPIARMQPWTR